MRCRAWQPDPDDRTRHMVCGKPHDHQSLVHVADGTKARWRWSYWPDNTGPTFVRALSQETATSQAVLDAR